MHRVGGYTIPRGLSQCALYANTSVPYSPSSSSPPWHYFKWQPLRLMITSWEGFPNPYVRWDGWHWLSGRGEVQSTSTVLIWSGLEVAKIIDLCWLKLWLKSASPFRWGGSGRPKNPITLLHKSLIAKLAIPLLEKNPLTLISISSLQCWRVHTMDNKCYFKRLDF